MDEIKKDEIGFKLSILNNLNPSNKYHLKSQRWFNQFNSVGKLEIERYWVLAWNIKLFNFYFLLWFRRGGRSIIEIEERERVFMQQKIQD